MLLEILYRIKYKSKCGSHSPDPSTNYETTNPELLQILIGHIPIREKSHLAIKTMFSSLRILDITVVGYSKIETVDQHYDITDSVPTGRDTVIV